MNGSIAKPVNGGFKAEKWAFAMTLGLVLLVMPDPAMAGTNVNSMANSILSLLTGPLAKTFAAIAIVVAGFMYFTGRAQVQTLISIVIGCFLVFSAEWIVNLLAN